MYNPAYEAVAQDGSPQCICGCRTGNAADLRFVHRIGIAIIGIRKHQSIIEKYHEMTCSRPKHPFATPIGTSTLVFG